MAAVDSAVGMDLEMEADAHPAVEPARPASRADPLLQKLALQGDALRGGGAGQVSHGQEVERDAHRGEGHTRWATRSIFSRSGAPRKPCARTPARTPARRAPGHYPPPRLQEPELFRWHGGIYNAGDLTARRMPGIQRTLSAPGRRSRSAPTRSVRDGKQTHIFHGAVRATTH